MYIAEEVRELIAGLCRGNDRSRRPVEKSAGRCELYKAKGLDFSKIFYRPEVGPDVAVRKGSRPGSRPGVVARLDDAAPRVRAGPGAVSRSRWSSRSATSTARWARSSAAS